jgi:hypothetical protein
MSGESDDVDRLAQSIADGASINWDEIDKLPADARLRRLFALLEMVDGVAEVHRSLGDPSHATDPDDHTTPAPVDAPAAGDSIGQWGHLVLRRKIGEGGFGEVYHAHDTWLDHSVALKLFKPKVTSRESANRILHEARKLARIRHPNIVTVHGADSHNGQVGFWMDLIEGTTLEHIVRAGRLSAGEAAYIGQEVCRALAAVHLAGIVHRDVKAQNVMRATDGGRIILMDFGAGEFMKEQAANARKQGTPLYLAPEVFMGADASVRSDIYAVGVLMYYLVTSGFPVRGGSVAELIDAHRQGERRRLRDGRPDLPQEFVSVVERALDPDPARRFASAGEMEAALAGGPIVPFDPAPIKREGTERTPVHRILIGAAAAFMATAMIGWIACRLFDTVVGVHSDLAAGPADYLSVGAVALLPFGIFWSVGVGMLVVLASMVSLFRSPLAAIRPRMHSVKSTADGATVATLVLVTGIAGWLAIVWHCADIFSAIGALSAPTPVTAELSVLGSPGRSLQRTLYVSSAYLSFLLALAIWRWFPTFEQYAADASRVRLLKWATVVVALLVVVTGTASWRLAWERFEVVAFEKRPAFVIGNNSDELLLYYPYGDAPKHRRVRKDAPTLQRTGAQARLFDRQ